MELMILLFIYIYLHTYVRTYKHMLVLPIT